MYKHNYIYEGLSKKFVDCIYKIKTPKDTLINEHFLNIARV